MIEAAVLTGDFVKSSRGGGDELGRGFEVLGRACTTLAGWHGEDLRLTRHRGDGWQCLLARPALSLRSALYVAAALRAEESIETRQAIGLGGVESRGSEDLADADGPAFREAGHTLDAMKRNRRVAIASGGAAPQLAPALVALCDARAQDWTVAQARVLLRALLPEAPTQAATAQELGIKQQSVADHLDAAGFWALEEALLAFEGALS